MDLTPEMAAAATGLNAKVLGRLAEDPVGINEIFKQVSDGELELVETLTDAESRITRRLFGWMAEAGLDNVWKLLGAAVSEALYVRAHGPEWTEHPSFDQIEDAIASEARRLGLNVDEMPSAGVVEEFIAEAKDAFQRHGLLGLALIVLSYIFYESFHFPQPELGEYDIANDLFEKVKWVYKYWFNQLEVAEKGSGIEEVFLAQELRNRDPRPFDDEVPEPSSNWRVSIAAAGDLLAVDALLEGDTSHLFDDIEPFFSTADVVSANLESTVDESKPIGRHQATGMPAQMNTSRKMFDAFRDDAGINFFASATNHALDWGEDGVLATLDVLDESGANHAGTARSSEDQEDVLVIDKNGIKIALLSYTFDLNSMPVPDGREYLASMVRFNDARPEPDYSLVDRQIAIARQRGAEAIIAYCHWGWEFEMYPHVNIRHAAHELVARGVDVILGNHPHVSQPAEVIRRPAPQQDALVFYAFGDFVSYHPESRNSKLAYAVKFLITKVNNAGTHVVTWDHVRALPLYIVNARRGNGFDCRIVRFEKVLEDPDAYGLTEREKSELPHLRDVVWGRILHPLSHIPSWDE